VRRLLYTLLVWLLLPYMLFHLVWRGRRQPAYLRHIGERFGRYSQRAGQPLIWVHAVSVGETRAAVPLIRRLQERYPRHRILLTHMTPTGRETGEQLFGEDVLRCYLPYDFPFAVGRFLDHFRPEVGLLMETEIWFNLIHAARRRGVPLLLVNGRMSEKSARGYARFGVLAQASLQELAAVAAQTEVDAQRLMALGANSVQVAGNLKFDMEPPEAAFNLGRTLRARFGANRPIFLAASTREGEEALLLDALPQLSVPGLLTVIVPRHPQRFDQVAAMLAQRGIPFQRRSAEEPVRPDTSVVLGDSMGEMFAYYVASDLAFIGGSLLPFGGQNLIEAAAVGTPVLVGPHTHNFQEAAQLAVECGAAVRVDDVAALTREIRQLFENRPRLAAMGAAGKAFSARHRGATGRTMALLEPFLEERPGSSQPRR
jgi:3-deoxy-D-manno-octulosonic-acid transferase